MIVVWILSHLFIVVVFVKKMFNTEEKYVESQQHTSKANKNKLYDNRRYNWQQTIAINDNICTTKSKKVKLIKIEVFITNI